MISSLGIQRGRSDKGKYALFPPSLRQGKAGRESALNPLLRGNGSACEQMLKTEKSFSHFLMGKRIELILFP